MVDIGWLNPRPTCQPEARDCVQRSWNVDASDLNQLDGDGATLDSWAMLHRARRETLSRNPWASGWSTPLNVRSLGDTLGSLRLCRIFLANNEKGAPPWNAGPGNMAE